MGVSASVDRRVLWPFGCDAPSRPAPISVVEVQDVVVDPCDGFIIGCVPHDVNDVPFHDTKKGFRGCVVRARPSRAHAWHTAVGGEPSGDVGTRILRSTVRMKDEFARDRTALRFRHCHCSKDQMTWCASGYRPSNNHAVIQILHHTQKCLAVRGTEFGDVRFGIRRVSVKWAL